MQIHFGIDLMRAEWNRAVACIGTFDGVHRGHQAVIAAAVREARSTDSPCVLVTFDRHPAAVLAPERCPKAISSLQANLRHFEELSVAVAVVLRFDAALSETSAQHFLDAILRGAIKADRLVIGHDFAMGNHREGSPEWLQSRIPTTVIPPFEIDGERVSSSHVRRAVVAGEMDRVQRWLGRPFAIEGIVVEGDKLGRQLGYPTANLARSYDQVDARDGVYAGRLTCEDGQFMAAVSIGTRPAVGGARRTIEAYLLDYPGQSLYGRPVTLELVQYLRPELDFPNLDQLIEQIALDVDWTRKVLLEPSLKA